MLTNKEAGFLEPDQDCLECVEKIRAMKTLAQKIEQIGAEIQMSYLEMKDDQSIANMYYMLNYLRSLAVDECDPPLTYGMVLVNSDGTKIATDLKGNTEIKRK